jgi:excisionase family DNA binding protein
MQSATATPRLNRFGQPIVRKRTATPQQLFLTIPQAAAYTGWPERKIYAHIAKGRLPFVRFEGERRIWIDRADLQKLAEANKERRRPQEVCA